MELTTNAATRSAAGTNATPRGDLASAGQRPGDGREGQNARGNAEAQAQQGSQPGQERGQQGGSQRAENAQGGQRGEGQSTQTASNGEQAANAPGQPDQQGANAGRGRGNERANRLTDMFTQPDQQGAENQNGGGGGGGPLTGPEFSDWNQRLSNVEELVDRSELRNQLAQVRDRARAVRSEFKRNSKPPQWDLVNLEIVRPLVEVRERIADELSRHESSESLAPIDRDPVPNKYGELVRRYYETLGNSQ
jgi:hypothetical protein